MRTSIRLLLACIALVFAASAQAGVIADFTGGIPASPSGDTVGGWEFEVSSAVSLSGLGFWDEGADGLVSRHSVGLFDANGTPLATVVVSSASTAVASTSIDGQWLFESITPIILQPGIYVLAATFLDQDADAARIVTPADITTIAEITVTRALQETNTSSLTLPTQDFGPGAIFGANAILTAVVPEPNTLAPALLGIAGVVGLIARRRMAVNRV
ncbi:MAG: hypothetical protein SFX72_01560 [Isosphaeraceae bacterium]|nr:hypothetical protein [Isosphaeraceae bacterium]